MDFHPIGRWRGEGSGFVAATIRRHQAEHYWPSYYPPPAYATPTMYASSPFYSPYGYGGGYPAYFGYYSQPILYYPPTQTSFQQPSPHGMGACPNCGSPLQCYVNFCDRCGTRL